VPFEQSLRLSIALGLTIFLVLLRFDSERIMRSDYFRYRYPWMGPLSYYGLVIAFAIGIVVVLPNGRGELFLAPGDPDKALPIMLAFSAVAVLNAIAFAFRWYGGITPLPTPLLPTRLIGAAASAVADELQFRSRCPAGSPPRSCSRPCSTASPSGGCGASGSGTSSSAR